MYQQQRGLRILHRGVQAEELACPRPVQPDRVADHEARDDLVSPAFLPLKVLRWRRKRLGDEKDA